MWTYHGQKRPSFAEEPAPGQESVWDYPRPPRLMADGRRIVVRLGELIIAESMQAYRVLETASPPAFYIPPDDVRLQLLQPHPGSSVCEWKGIAHYWALKTAERSTRPVGWSYPSPTAPFAALSGYFSFYPARVECYVDGERVQPQPGEFYGGWLTHEIAGPFKGLPGTESW
jgi:uncharacterized protein (DUF427 family)